MRTILGWTAALTLWSVVFGAFAYAQQRPPGCPPVCFLTEWYTYRHDNSRTGAQPFASPLSDPKKVAGLSIEKTFPAKGAVGGFRASPIVVNDTVFIGSTDGYFYALDAATLALKWQYPKASDPPLLGTCTKGGNGTFGAWGIYSSATYAKIGGQDAVIFGAPDPDPKADGGLGSARLFAFTLSGAQIWKSDIVAHVNGCTPGSLSQLHERIAYSSPLVLGDKVYVGVHDAGDDPIQQGRVSVVDLSTGKVVPFSYVSTGTLGDGTHGGGVWNSFATEGTGVYFTTGNTRNPYCNWPYDPNNPQGLNSPQICMQAPANCPCPIESEPSLSPNHGLSMIRVDKDTGDIVWAFQPVDFIHDGDPDWAAGATVMSTSCGELIASVMKDGWSYAVNAANGSMQWQFPATGLGSSFLNDYQHGDDGYRAPGAAWNDVFIVKTGGYARADSPENVTPGYGQLHALNACPMSEHDRIRWIASNYFITSFIPPPPNALGAPTVTGGIVFIGTDRGWLQVLADPSVVPPSGYQCSNGEYYGEKDCTAAGYYMVPIPTLLASVQMFDGGDLADLRKEPALANGRVFVATGNGHVYMLDTLNPPPPPPPPPPVCTHCRTPEECCKCRGGIWDPATLRCLFR